MIKYLKDIDSFFEDNKFDIVHSHVANYGAFYMYYAKKHGIKNRILHSHANRNADKIFNLGKAIIDGAESMGCVRMFDEFNIRNSKIRDIEYKDDKFYAYVAMDVLYMDYYLSKTSGNVVDGNNQKRTAHTYTMVFSKERTAKEQILVKTCPNCGASLNTNETGICPYCHSVYNQEDHDWVLEDIIGFEQEQKR